MKNPDATTTNEAGPEMALPWQARLHGVLKAREVRQASYVPDAGHAALIDSLCEDENIHTNVLTTEEEGIALAVGAWLGGQRSVLLMQSSGVGNCINMLSLPVQTRTPLLMLVTMRGSWAEFNPWQVPMGRATETVLNAAGVTVFRAETGDDVVATADQAAGMAFDADQQVAVLIGQRVLGKKKW